MNHHNQVMDFSNLNFEAIDNKVLANKAKEQEETTTATARGGGAADARWADPSQGDKAIAPPAW